MACCIFFCHSSSSSPSDSSSIINNVRVVDLNGHVEEFDYPVSVSQIRERPQRHFVFTAAQLLSVASLKPLKPETLLEPGCIYFLIPSSAFGHEVSPLDLASIVKKLTAKAKSVDKPERNKILLRSAAQYGPSSSSLVWNSADDAGVVETKLSRKRTWRPILDTIREVSSVAEPHKGEHVL